MVFIYINPTQFKTETMALINMMKQKKNYLKQNNNQPSAKDNKTPGDILFTDNVYKSDKYKLDLSHYRIVLQNNLLSEQEKKFYMLEKFLLETADEEYEKVSNVGVQFNANCDNLLELKANKISGKDNKIVYVVPPNYKAKSNFWTTLFFIELTKNKITPDYVVDSINRLSRLLIATTFPDHALYNYIVVISDDISYSGSQLSEDTFNSIIAPNVKLFFNLIGYSEVALNTINKRKIDSGNTCEIIFGRGAKYPLNKLSAKFDDKASVKNNILYLKYEQDFGGINPKINIKMMSSLLLNDALYMSKLHMAHNIFFVSKIFNKYIHYESKTRSSNRNNGSVQYLPFKYPDAYSTVENMCKFSRLQNVALIRVDRLIHYLDLPGQSDNDKLDRLSEGIIKENLWDDSGDNVYINSIIIQYFIQNIRPPNFPPILPNSLDKKFINIFKLKPGKGYLNDINENILNNFNGTHNDESYNNTILNYFVNLNNKISKFNKKHLIEYVMPKSLHQTKLTSKYNIKNCSGKDFNAYDMSSNSFCNVSCNLNFYKKINWD